MGMTTHRGDGGETRLGSGEWVRKDDPRIGCVGTLDELSSLLGLARAVLLTTEVEPRRPEAQALVVWLVRTQREIYLLGAELARRDGSGGVGRSRITAQHVQTLDREIEETDANLPKLRFFILPGGGIVAGHLHVARAICRRAERQAVRLSSGETLGAQVVPYLNRLSLALFSMARLAAVLSGASDEPA
jgi:cob(I)alamin adenosyltransferase